ncbi:MAG: GDSL-type esterase/lipase family protein [bacterium]
MNQRIALTALALLCLVTALAHATDGRKVVVLGSSTAAGTGPAHWDSAWVNRFRADALAGDSLRVVTNYGVGGFTTYHIMPDGYVPPPGRPLPAQDLNISKAIRVGADAVIINLPSNDQVNGYDIQETIANYDTVMAVAAAAGVQVWLSTTQPRNTTAQIRAALMAMRDTTYALWGDRAVDFWTTIANEDGTINSAYDSGDGVHLNDRAHGILFDRVAAKHIWDAIAPPVTGVGPMVASADWRMYPASPNPFRRETTLSYSLSTASHVLLSLYDVRGRKVGTLVDGEAAPGLHRVSLDGRALPSGVYFYRLETAAGAAVGKAVRIE